MKWVSCFLVYLGSNGDHIHLTNSFFIILCGVATDCRLECIGDSSVGSTGLNGHLSLTSVPALIMLVKLTVVPFQLLNVQRVHYSIVDEQSRVSPVDWTFFMCSQFFYGTYQCWTINHYIFYKKMPLN